MAEQAWSAAIDERPDDAGAHVALEGIAQALGRAREPDQQDPDEEEPDPARRTERRHLSLEAAITAYPEDDHAWGLYADWLQSQGDVRGEIVAFSLRGDRRGLDLAARHADLLLGGFADYHQQFAAAEGRSTIDLEWKHGFIVGAKLWFYGRVHTHLAQILPALFDAAPLLRQLEIRAARLKPEVLSLLTSATPPGLRTLRLRMRSRRPVPLDLGRLVFRCPSLTTLDVDGVHLESVTGSDSLASLRIEDLALDPRLFAALLSDDFPALTHLSVVDASFDEAVALIDRVARCPRVQTPAG